MNDNTFYDIEWRPYQNKIHDAIHKSLKKGKKHLLIAAAMGTGKRIMAIREADHFKKTLFIAHREELISQAVDDFDKYFPMQVGVIRQKRFEIDKRFVVGSVQTLINRLDKLDPKMFDHIIIDEAHHYLAKTFLQVVRHFDPVLRSLWSATPFRLDGLDLSNISEEIVYEYPIEEGIKDGFLCQINAVRCKTHIDISKVKTKLGDFANNELNNTVNNPIRNRLIVNRYKKYADGRSGIGFCCSVSHAENLAQMFRDHDISAKAISCHTPKDLRDQYIQQFKKGEIKILTNVDILTEGFDHKDTGVVLMARPTKSKALYMQMVGRVTRLKSDTYCKSFGDKYGIVLDFVDISGHHELVNTFTLDKKKRFEDKVFITENKRNELIGVRDKEIREKQERNAKIMSSVMRDQEIDLLALPKTRGMSGSRARDEATPKQIDYLKALGLWQPGVEYTKGQCSSLISNKELNPDKRADSWKLKMLAEWGYDITNGATIGQYQQVKQERERQNDSYHPSGFKNLN